MSIQEEQPAPPRTRRQAAGRQKEARAGDVVQPPLQRHWQDSASGFPLLPDEQPVTTVRDSLYDLIPLGPREVKLIGSAPFLRLQKVKQLGFVYRIWPGATHTRYEHSLGVYHLAVRALRALWLRGDEGGLTGIATILENDYHLSPERVADFIDPPKNKVLHPDDELLNYLLSGALDVDKLDYLPRDARACNVPYGGVDVARLQGALRIHQNVNGQRRIVVTHKGISPLYSLIHARQEMFDNIYWHHTSRAMQMMLLRAVHDALDAGALQAKQLMGLDDASLLALLANERMPGSARALANDLELRRPYKGVIEVSHLAGRLFKRLEALFWDAQRRRRVEQMLAAELSRAMEIQIADYEVLFDIPRPEKWEMDVWVSFEHPPVGMDSLMTWVQATGLQPDDLARYELHQRRIRVVVAERLRQPLLAHRDILLSLLEELV